MWGSPHASERVIYINATLMTATHCRNKNTIHVLIGRALKGYYSVNGTNCVGRFQCGF
jgi:hypothetical protein